MTRVLDDFLVLEQNYPNPVTGETSFHFHLARPMLAELAIYDLRGYQVALPQPAALLDAGRHEVRWAPGELAPGTYIFQLSAEGARKAKLLTLKR